MRQPLAEFTAAFDMLRAACGDDPERLLALAAADIELQRLAARADDSFGHSLRALGRQSQAERTLRDGALRQALQDYAARYAGQARRAGEGVWQAEAAARLAALLAGTGQAAPEAANPAALVADLLADVQELAYDHEGAAFGEKLHKGLSAWERFEQALQLDLFGISRRWRLLRPELLGADEGASVMRQQLGSAARAFVFGCVAPAVALARDLMRDALHAMYGVAEDDLEAMIVNAEDRHPALRALRLNSRRRLAEDILNEPGRAQKVGERAVADLLEAVGALIEPRPRG